MLERAAVRPLLHRESAQGAPGRREGGQRENMYGVMCELKESFGPRRVWVLNPRHATGGHHDDTGLRGVVPDVVCAD